MERKKGVKKKRNKRYREGLNKEGKKETRKRREGKGNNVTNKRI
jgi:hypothetical protein